MSYRDDDSVLGWIFSLILYLMYLMFMAVVIFMIGFVTLMIGTSRGLVKGISHSLELYFGTLVEEIGER